MEIEELFGLPAHPLVVHAAVVLLALSRDHDAGVRRGATAPGGTTRRWRSAWRWSRPWPWVWPRDPVRSWRRKVDETELVEEHTEHGEQVLPWAIAVTVAAAGVAAIPMLERRRPTLRGRTVTAVVVAVSLISWCRRDLDGHRSGSQRCQGDLG